MTKIDDAIARVRDFPKHRASFVQLIKTSGARVIAEIGVYRCETAQRVLDGCLEQLRTYYLVDAWKPFGAGGKKGEEESGCPIGEDWRNDYQTALWLEERHPEVITVLRGDSVEMAALVEDKSLDLCYIDADHAYGPVRKDIDAWLPKVRVGGIICGHDFYSRWPGVIQAVTETFHHRSLNFLPDTVWYATVTEKHHGQK